MPLNPFENSLVINQLIQLNSQLSLINQYQSSFEQYQNNENLNTAPVFGETPVKLLSAALVVGNKFLSNLTDRDLQQTQQQQQQQQKQQQQQQQQQCRYKTELCRQFKENGQCLYGQKCQFAHGISELKGVDRHPKYKTQLCKTFHSNGVCMYGPRCNFIHNIHDNQPIRIDKPLSTSSPRSLAVAAKSSIDSDFFLPSPFTATCNINSGHTSPSLSVSSTSSSGTMSSNASISPFKITRSENILFSTTNQNLIDFQSPPRNKNPLYLV